MHSVQPDDIKIQNFTEADIELWVDYLHNSSAEFLKSFGVDKAKVPSKNVLVETLMKNLNSDGLVTNFVAIKFKDEIIGNHNVNHIVENESALFHAQIWKDSLRGKGIGQISYVKACDHFLKSLSLKKIIFKTPKGNVPAQRIKQKLGLVAIGSVIYENSFMFEPMDCLQYEIDQKMIDDLMMSY